MSQATQDAAAEDLFALQNAVGEVSSKLAVGQGADLSTQQAHANEAKQAAVRSSQSLASDYTNEQHQRNTDLLAQMNESWNSNRYILNAVSKEKKRLEQLDTQAKRDIYLSRQAQQSADYSTNLYTFLTRMIMFTLLTTLALLVPVALWRDDLLSATAMLFIDSILLCIYAVAVVVLVRHAALRRQTMWDQYYFSTKSVRSSKTCP
jgi:hypothetical protein